MQLNLAQTEAVDHIYGPLLVLAGPGTGKTQLLSARIANILEKTDANAQNILCLTFTEAAAQNMRERLASIIKDDAYDVHINTYHGFGSDIIRSYPSYFETIDLETGEDSRLERPIDDLQRIQIMTELISKLPYDSPLIGARHYVKHVSSTISELKRGLYTPKSLGDLANRNLVQVQELSPRIAEHLAQVTRFPSTVGPALELFSGIVDILENHEGLAEQARESLEEAMAEASELGKSKPLTAWKNTWLTKDDTNRFQFTDQDQHKRIIELAKLYDRYNKTLAEHQLYDFDDMILRTIDALKNQDELRFNLQEKYQFILLDEFQDTNAAQFELVRQLADNPVNEGQPNIFAVGDDDQAIYAFQGAKLSNMLAFKTEFKDVKVINLSENYRSHPDILHVAHNIAEQIEFRLHHELESITKTLTASNTSLPKNAVIERHEFSGQANEYAWVANRIQQLIQKGTNPSEIAVLAPKHTLLELLVPFLSLNNTPISYEKREDILQTRMLRSFRSMVELLLAVKHQNTALMDELFPQVLSLDFYNIPVSDIWQANWTAQKKDEQRSWAEIALHTPTLKPHVLFYLALGLKEDQEPLEYVLDDLAGSASIKLDPETTYTSPLKSHYFTNLHTDDALEYYELLANLSTIREHLRAWQAGTDKLLSAQDFINFITAHESADQPLINTHPIAQSTDSVQLMTAYKAKGLEFEHVFLLSVHDDIWGKKARSNSNKLSLPANLQHIRYAGSSEDELRRILFVAITRAKHGLYFTSHASKDNGKATEPVKYLLEFDDGDTRKTTVLPESSQLVKTTNFTAQETMQQVETLWQSRHINLTAELKELLQPRLTRYQMSPTHLNTFIDTEYGGPEVFLLQTLLKFPQAPGEDGEFGNAIHQTLEWLQNHANNPKIKTDTQSVIKKFDDILSRKYIAGSRMDDMRNRGHLALNSYLSARSDMFSIPAQAEVDFRSEGVLIGKAHLSGKIDRLEIDTANKTVDIVDFKTGSPHEKWDTSTKLLKYKQQLYFYKFLIEGSHTWSSYKVRSARLEFVEPQSNGQVIPALAVQFDANEEQEMKQLIQIVWDCIKTLKLPDNTPFNDINRGTTEFISYLLQNYSK